MYEHIFWHYHEFVCVWFGGVTSSNAQISSSLYTQGSPLTGFGEPYMGVSGIEPELAMCKTSVLTLVLTLQQVTLIVFLS